VSIGYQYEDCDFIDWHENVVKLNGYDLATSEIGGWNIDVQHRLNFQQGKLASNAVLSLTSVFAL
jgi:hypothetical protein